MRKLLITDCLHIRIRLEAPVIFDGVGSNPTAATMLMGRKLDREGIFAMLV